MKEEKKKWGLGSRGWVLTLYTFLGFATWLAFGNYPINVLNPKYEGMFGWNPTYTSVAYSVATLLVVIFQLLIAKRIAASNVKRSTLIFGSMTLVMGLAIALITNQPLFLLFFILFRIFGDTWALVCNGILVGQWFPTRKGTVMGVATFAFPLGGGFGLALFSALASKGTLIAFMPFLIFGLLAIVLAAAFLSDYPEQVGAFRDNDRTMTPDQAHSIMMKEIEQKQNSCWHGKNLFVCRDFWFLVIPSGLLLFASVGIMIQIISVLVSIDQTFFSKFGPLVLSGISIFACIGSWILGLIDTKFSTKIAIIIAGICMFLAGIAGAVGTIPFVLLASFFLAIFMGASSNFTVSAAAEYWGRTDFQSVFACFSPIANIIGAPGPAVIAILASMYGFSASFLVVAVMGIVTIILPIFVKRENIAKKTQLYQGMLNLVPDSIQCD